MSRAGWELTITVRPDPDPRPCLPGSFSRHRGAGAIRNPEWRPGRRRVLPWFLPQAPLDETRRAYRAEHYGRHEADLAARADQRADLARTAQPALSEIQITAAWDGMPLGSISLGGIDVDAPTDPSLLALVESLVPQAISAGRNALARLRADQPQTEPGTTRPPNPT